MEKTTSAVNLHASNISEVCLSLFYLKSRAIKAKYAPIALDLMDKLTHAWYKYAFQPNARTAALHALISASKAVINILKPSVRRRFTYQSE